MEKPDIENCKPRASVLFVCLGNICRSPAAEGVFLDQLAKRNLAELVHVDSAGTIGLHRGKPADERMLASASRRGIVLPSRSRKVTTADLGRFAWVIAMDRENLSNLLRIAEDSDGATATIQLLSDFLGDDWPTDVPDPYYGGDEGFEYVLDMIEAAIPKLIETIALR